MSKKIHIDNPNITPEMVGKVRGIICRVECKRFCMGNAMSASLNCKHERTAKMIIRDLFPLIAKSIKKSAGENHAVRPEHS